MKAEAALDVCPICEGTGWKTLESDKVRSQLDGKQVAQVIYVPGRLVNVVLR